ncbi:MAG: MetQ/NlpA family ABC transporter substrate-binding protein [Acholeplasma sp.]|nr:MetQ/NlpA family ABC transporter substrate-binding protein [Acholeplasma sp.]
MKKIISLLFILTVGLVLNSCNKDNEKTIKVVATEKPHSEILEEARKYLEEKGYKLEIEVITKYALGNPAVENGSADANFFQHLPYFNEQNTKGNLVNIGGVHIEPIGLYGGTLDDINKLKKGDKIIISDNAPDYGRIVLFLKNIGLVTTIDGFDPETEISNPENAIASKTVDFSFEIISADLLVTAQKNKEGAFFFINGNYALTGGLSLNDALVKEPTNNNPYVNIIVVKKGNENLDKIIALKEVLQSKEIKDFITKKYAGSVIPA